MIVSNPHSEQREQRKRDQKNLGGWRAFKKNSPVVVTSALPYANSEPHIGHLRSTYLPADIFARYLKAKGYDAYHVSGTDEHGTPILARALKEGRDPKEIVDHYHGVIKEAFTRAGIHFDIFSRTTKKEHYNLTVRFYETAKKEGYIYTKEIQILYCEHDKIALPDRLVIGTCPYCGAPNQYGDHCEVCGRTYTPLQLKDPRCAICGRPPVIKTSKHAFFALSRFSDKLKKWIENDVKLTPGVKEHVLSWIKGGLQDWDITRDISWGVPVPDLSDQVFYVWWDAPIGYISFTRELFQQLGKDWEKVWVDGEGYIVHFIGKDIIYHHVLFWPAMLMAVGFALPNEIRVRGFATLEKEKMSKSRGHYIGINEFLDFWPADYLRFYWALTTSESLTDGDFSFRDFQERINKILIGEYGNFTYRVLTLIRRGKVESGEPIPKYIEEARNLWDKYEKLMISNQLDAGLNVAISVSSLGNKLLSETEPWRKLGSKEASDALVTGAILAVTSTVLLDPFVPETTKVVKGYFGVPEDPRESLSLAQSLLAGNAGPEGLLKHVNSLEKISPPIKKVKDEDVERILELLRKRTRRT